MAGLDCRFNDYALTKHAAHILVEAKGKAGGKPFATTPTAAAAQYWGMEVVIRSARIAAMAGCMPNYFNLERGMDRVTPEARRSMTCFGVWGHGIENFLEHLENWSAEGGMQDIEVRM